MQQQQNKMKNCSLLKSLRVEIQLKKTTRLGIADYKFCVTVKKLEEIHFSASLFSRNKLVLYPWASVYMPHPHTHPKNYTIPIIYLVVNDTNTVWNYVLTKPNVSTANGSNGHYCTQRGTATARGLCTRRGAQFTLDDVTVASGLLPGTAPVCLVTTTRQLTYICFVLLRS